MTDQPTDPPELPPLDGGDLSFPFQAAPPGMEADLSVMRICGGLVVLAVVVPTPAGPLPGVIFHFHHGDGTAHQPLLLVQEAVEMSTLPDLVGAAAYAAIMAVPE